MVILVPRKFFSCLQKVKRISSFLHYRNHPLSSTSSLSPPTLESLMHTLTKWTARQWRLIYSNKKYKKAREILAKWPNRATTSYRVPALHLQVVFRVYPILQAYLVTERKLKPFFPGHPSCRNNTDLWVGFPLCINNISHKLDKYLKV